MHIMWFWYVGNNNAERNMHQYNTGLVEQTIEHDRTGPDRFEWNGVMIPGWYGWYAEKTFVFARPLASSQWRLLLNCTCYLVWLKYRMLLCRQKQVDSFCLVLLDLYVIVYNTISLYIYQYTSCADAHMPLKANILDFALDYGFFTSSPYRLTHLPTH